jgi:dipeptidase D
VNFAKERNLEYKVDEAGNVVIRKPADTGMEDKPTVVLQSHMDMVCEKNNDTDFDFSTDPIQLEKKDDVLTAKGTTLGADDGIGVATALAILEDTSLTLGPIEALFTVDE